MIMRNKTIPKKKIEFTSNCILLHIGIMYMYSDKYIAILNGLSFLYRCVSIRFVQPLPF